MQKIHQNVKKYHCSKHILLGANRLHVANLAKIATKPEILLICGRCEIHTRGGATVDIVPPIWLPVYPARVDIWRDRCDRRSRKNVVNCVNK